MFVIPKTMRAVVYRGVNDLRLETVPVPRPGPNELLVKVAVCGVCPTDIKKIRHGTVPPPRIFGHETAGTIVQIGGGAGGASVLASRSNSSGGASVPASRSNSSGGANVPASRSNSPGGASVLASRLLSRFKIGDRVALHHHVPCLDCHFCRHHAFAQCETYKRTGITAGFEPAGGGYAEYVRVMPFVLPGVVKIPAKNSFEEGAMLEPVNTVLKAVRRLNLLRGDVVLVAGQGPIGLMFTRLLQLAGARVLATDLLESRLQLAKQFGAKWTLNVRSSRREEALIEKSEIRNPKSEIKMRLVTSSPTSQSLDAAVIAVPSDAAVFEALQLVRGGGQVLLFAHTRRSAPIQNSKFKIQNSNPQLSTLNPQLDFSSICLDEKDLIGSYSSDFTLQSEVARLVFSRQLDVRRLITHRFPLAKTANAIALAAKPTSESLKVLVEVDED
ncbi:MAG TPA: alcohol dehydrogenase catalytic domain-containing protein [Verrucomicrobiae bacterium]|nr:alcohol dehydrogenase catalytic domain-containing protein [Verrucomicrobiae bacterium]